jgi:putative acetyltransferase
VKNISVAVERPDTPDATALVAELDAYLIPQYPLESHHGLPVEQLIEAKVAFFVLRSDGAPAGCGGVQCFGDEYAELKRLYVRPLFRGNGLGGILLRHLEGYSRTQGIGIIRLETGILQREAISLYEKSGYRRIPPFGAYLEDPLSIFYEKRLL